MATIALRASTVGPEGTIAGGHCYIIFPEPAISVAELIIEKVRAECRKIRAGGPHVSRLDLLTGYAFDRNPTPADEETYSLWAIDAFLNGGWFLVVDGQRLTAPDAILFLTRRTTITFCGYPYMSDDATTTTTTEA
jgi:hypothetical protein